MTPASLPKLYKCSVESLQTDIGAMIQSIPSPNFYTQSKIFDKNVQL